MNKKTWIASLALVSGLASTATFADEGMWQPHQLSQIKSQLKKAGLKLDPAKMADLSQFPMNAIVSLGGCSASFLSNQGLVVTNHHCAYGSIQYNSTEENNLLKNGFLAESFDQELPATPGSRIYVTEEITDVSKLINAGISDKMSGKDRYDAIDKNSKALVSSVKMMTDTVVASLTSTVAWSITCSSN